MRTAFQGVTHQVSAAAFELLDATDTFQREVKDQICAAKFSIVC